MKSGDPCPNCNSGLLYDSAESLKCSNPDCNFKEFKTLLKSKTMENENQEVVEAPVEETSEPTEETTETPAE